MAFSDQSTSSTYTAATTTSLAVAPPSPRSPLQSKSMLKPKRHVFFSDLPPKHRAKDSPERGGSGNENCRSLCLALCAWSCLAAFALVLVVLLVLVLFAAFVHAGLPAISIRGIKFAKLEVQNSSSTSSTVSADVEFLVEFANGNDRIEVSFAPLAVEASAQAVSLGKSRIGAFSQLPGNTTELRLSTAVRGVSVEGDDANELAASLSGNSTTDPVAIVVVLRGTLGFHVGKIDIDGIPLLASCSAVKSEVDQGNKSPCNVRIFPM